MMLAGVAAGREVDDGGEDVPLVWLKSRDAAIASARAQGKCIFMLCGRETCGSTIGTRDYSCEEEEVREALGDFVLWFCNCDTQSDDFMMYVYDKVSFSLPLVCLINPSDPQKYIVRKFGYQTASGVLSILKAANPKTVKFDPNGGEVGEEERTVLPRSVVGKLPTPTRGKYTFLGWYTKKSGGTKVSVSTKVMSDVTYYAHWAAPWTVTLNPNGGSMNDQENKVLVARGKAVGTLPVPVKAGYVHKGWFTKKSGGSKITAKTKVTKDVTWYAQWTVAKYPVKVVKVGKGTVSGAGSKAYKSKVTLKAMAAKGYVFQAWYRMENGEDVFVSRKESYSFKVPLGGATYKAVFLTTAQDKAGIGLEFAGAGVGAADGGQGVATLSELTNVCGVAIAAMPVAASGLTPTSVTVSGLPTGLKYDTKKKAVVGTPTAIKTFTAKITVKSLGASRTWKFKWVIVPVPEWARGTFKGVLNGEGGALLGSLTLTIGKTGMVSGKLVDLEKQQYSFSVGSFKSFVDGVLWTKANMKYGTKTVALEIAVGQDSETSRGFAEVGSAAAPFNGGTVILEK